MQILRAVLATVLGYVVSQGVNGIFVYFWYVGDRPAPLAVLAPLTLVVFFCTGFATGHLTMRLGGPHALNATRAVAALIALVTVGNIVLDVAAEPLWHKLVVLLVMAPTVLWVAQKRGGTPSGGNA